VKERDRSRVRVSTHLRHWSPVLEKRPGSQEPKTELEERDTGSNDGEW